MHPVILSRAELLETGTARNKSESPGPTGRILAEQGCAGRSRARKSVGRRTNFQVRFCPPGNSRVRASSRAVRSPKHRTYVPHGTHRTYERQAASTPGLTKPSTLHLLTINQPPAKRSSVRWQRHQPSSKPAAPWERDRHRHLPDRRSARPPGHKGPPVCRNGNTSVAAKAMSSWDCHRTLERLGG